MTRRHFVRRGSLVAAAGVLPIAARRAWPQSTRPNGPPVSGQPASPLDVIGQGRLTAATAPIKTTKLTDTVFLLQGAGGNMVVQKGPDGKLLIDSSYSTAAQRIKDVLGKIDVHPLRLLINTHWHPDHTDGNAAMHDAGAFIVAHKNTRLRLSSPQVVEFFHMNVPAYPTSALPQQTFDESETLYFNNDELALVHLQPAHTDSDIYIFFANGNVLHAGDIWFNGMYPFIDASTGGNINGMIKGADQLLAVADDKTKIVPGHGPLGNKAALTAYREMLATVATRIEKLKGSGQTLEQVAAVKPTADLDAAWAKGMISADAFTTLVYSTLP